MTENAPFQPQSFNRGKFKELVLYFAQRSEERGDEGFGMVKLNKLLYRADFEAFRLLGRSITGETYERQEFGPVARDLLIVLDELGASGRLQWRHIPAGPYTRDIPTTSEDREERADRSVFEADELKMIESALDDLATFGGKAASRWSHKQSAGWKLARENGNTIEYRTALISTDSIPQEDLERLSQTAHERGWVKTS